MLGNSNRNPKPTGHPGKPEKKDLFHVLYKVPSGDSPYVRAKHAQLVERDPEAAMVLFWRAINAGDRVDSALKDMAIVMTQLDRAEEAIEAIESFRDRCSKEAQESLDNVLIDLYKKCGKVDQQIDLLKRKLQMIFQGEVFNGKATKTARSHGKKFQVSVKQETSRILGNLGWAYMQQSNYAAAEAVYRKAQQIDPDDANKACNLGLCLIKQARHEEALYILKDVLLRAGSNDSRSRNRAQELLCQLKLSHQPQKQQQCEVSPPLMGGLPLGLVEEGGLDAWREWMTLNRSRRLPIFEKISQLKDQMAC